MEKLNDDYRIIKVCTHPKQHQFLIRSDDLCAESAHNEIVLLHLEEAVAQHFKIIHDYNDDIHEINIPKDCIDALITALTLLKNDDPELKNNQRKYRQAEG